MFTKVASIDKVELMYMAVVFFFFLLSSVVFFNCPPKLSEIKVLKSVTTSHRSSEI